MANLDGTPNPPVSFSLEWLPSQNMPYKNKGTTHKLFVVRAGQVTTPSGLCVRIRARDAASLVLAEAVSGFSLAGGKASDFVQGLCSKLGLQVQVPSTGDVAGPHHAMRAKPIESIRYELDRVLAASGKPISLQFDDRATAQKLVGWEELYESDTSLLADALTGGSFSYGVGIEANNKGPGASYGSSLYHWEMDQDYGPAIWGHEISLSHLTVNGAQVTGTIKPRLLDKLGIKGDALNKGANRVRLPLGRAGAATTDDYYAKAVATNAVFQAEMSITRGVALIDPDFKAFDNPDLLNRKHILVGITGATNQPTKNAIVPAKSVVMGYEHRINQQGAFTRLLLRRGG
jgi:hypothetical protein